MNRKNSYRDMEKFRKTREEQKSRYYGKTQDAENRGQPWTADEMIAILNKSKTDTELSKEMGRSVKAIQVMRSRAKKRLEEGIDNG